MSFGYSRSISRRRAFVGEVGLDGSPQLRDAWDDQVEVF